MSAVLESRLCLLVCALWFGFVCDTGLSCWLYCGGLCGHVEVAAFIPGLGYVLDARADEHERALPVGEGSHDFRSPSYFPVQAFDHVVGTDTPAMIMRELVE